ncbi:glycosyltransferase family 2 protein [Bacteroides fragilis]|nr:glycosyltransferase [Bacteroides fragilis]
MEPLVSFIVNCYNGELYLKRCLDSILTQTYQNWELIFWDNASTDHSKEIFTSYGDKRFKYFNSDVKVSLGQARAWAVDVCRGDYISFLDVDDEWLPQKTEIQIREIQKDSYVLSYGSINEINADNPSKRKITTPRYSSGNIFGEQLVNFEANLPSSMIKRSALIQKKVEL